MTQPQNPNGDAKAIESRDYQIDFERDGKTHRICVRHHEVKSGVIQPYAAWDATEQDLRQAGFVLVNGAEFAAVSAELGAVRLELEETRHDAGRMCYLGNLIRQRDQAEQDELTRLVRKHPPRLEATSPTTEPGLSGPWKDLARRNAVAFYDAHRELDACQSALATERARAEELFKSMGYSLQSVNKTVEQLRAELAAANARAGRLEELARRVLNAHGYGDHDAVPGDQHNALSALRAALSVAPQASTEQVEETFCEGLYRGAMGIPPVATSSIPQVAQVSEDLPVMLSELVAALRQVESDKACGGKLDALADRLEGK